MIGAKIRRRIAGRATDFARRALEVAGDDPGILANAALALAFFGEDIGAMMALVDRALALNPNFARGWHISGTLRLWAGQPDIAIEHIEAALRLSPRARVGASLNMVGHAHFFRRDISRRYRNCSSRSRKIRRSRHRIGFSPPATRIWVGSLKLGRSLSGCARLPQS